MSEHILITGAASGIGKALTLALVLATVVLGTMLSIASFATTHSFMYLSRMEINESAPSGTMRINLFAITTARMGSCQAKQKKGD